MLNLSENKESGVSWLQADWPAPEWVDARVFTRCGGVSQGAWRGLNLGLHVGDQAADVERNRRLMREVLAHNYRLQWLRQVHGTDVVDIDTAADNPPVKEGDAVCIRQPGDGAVIMTADCLPVLFTDQEGTVAAAAHAGWRGLVAGVLENTVAAMQRPPETLLAWLGPAIGPCHFEVGDEVRQAFLGKSPDSESVRHSIAQAFSPLPETGKWLADLYALARSRLQAVGVNEIYGGGLCTYCDDKHFYSFRRESVTGRTASVICIKAR
ncbi:laccase [Pseudohongiella spirulinae]|uniref:Purine nucleoside phosphorylase n=2 Tax=Pseudohongiella spirulinae TaxID=1249552 RepID=A0A0S2KFN2_9GAMM|nr:laccase [Pseudohongiella spirulinae]